MRQLCRQPPTDGANESRQCAYAQAKDSRRCLEIQRQYPLRLFTVLYYYCFPNYTLYSQGFRFRYSLALLKLFSSMDSATPNCLQQKIVFAYARPFGVTASGISLETVFATRRLRVPIILKGERS